MAEYAGYVYHEFPKAKYHKELGGTVVNNAKEEGDLGKDWADKPFEANAPVKPVEQPLLAEPVVEDRVKRAYHKKG